MIEDHPADDVGDQLPERASIRRNVFHMLSSQLFTWALATVLSVVVPRYLGPSTQGQLLLATSLWAIGAIFVDFGTSEYLRLQIARHRRKGLRLVGPVLAMRTLAFLMTALVLGVYVALTASTETLVVIMILSGIGSLVATWVETMSTAFIGMERMATPAMATAAAKLLHALAVLAVIWRGGNVYAILAVSIAVSFWTLGHLSWSYRKVSQLQFRGWTDQVNQVVKGSVPYMAVGTALVVYTQIDVIVISWVAGDETLGWYSTAELLWGSLLFPATVITTTTFPTFGRLHQDDPKKLTELVERTFALLTLAAVPIGLGVALVAPSFVPVLYGEAFREAGAVLAVLGPVTTLTFATTLFGIVALATERTRVWVWVLFASAALTIPLDLLLVPWTDRRFGNGAVGGAIAYFITELFQVIIGLWLVVPYLCRRGVVWYVARVAIAGGVMFVVGWPLRELPLPIPAVVCCIVYSIAVVALRIVQEDQQRLIGEVLARIGIRTRWAP